MIAKSIKGRGFRGALEYDLNEEKGQVIDKNMAGETPRELAAEFGAVRKLRPNLTRAVAHVSLSAAPGEHLSDEQWLQIGRKYLRDMGFDGCQYVITRHHDTQHEHIHILVNRIGPDGNVVSDSKDYERHEPIMREIERAYGLQAVRDGIRSEVKQPTRGEVRKAERTGEASARMQLQALCDAAMAGAGAVGVYIERLEAAGVRVVPTLQLGGEKLSGLLYELDGEKMKGSDLGTRYTPNGLEKKGVTYDRGRDFEAASRAASRAAAERTQPADRGREVEQGAEHRGTGSGDRAVGPGDGVAVRRPAVASPADDQREPGSGRGVEPAPGSGGRSDRARVEEVSRPAERGHRPGEGVGIELGRSIEPASPVRIDALAVDDRHRSSDGGAADRIVDLAAPFAAASRARHQSGRTDGSAVPDATRRADMPTDRTAEAVNRQLEAMDCKLYEVGARDPAKGMMIRRWAADMVRKSVAWLRRMNAQGNDVYIRPDRATASSLVLLDDLSREKVAALPGLGLEPCMVTQTSRGNFQAWIRLSTEAQPPAVRTAVAQRLARELGADPKSADFAHFGRLAGFTNRKPERAANGKQPFVLVEQSNPRAVASSGLELARDALQELALRRNQEVAEVAKASAATLKPADTGRWHLSNGEARGWYQSFCKTLADKFGSEFDQSRADWMASLAMYAKGYDFDHVAGNIAAHSPAITDRKGAGAVDYVTRTAGKAEIWHELKARGAAWDDVKNTLLDAAKARAEARSEQAQQAERARARQRSFER